METNTLKTTLVGTVIALTLGSALLSGGDKVAEQITNIFDRAIETTQIQLDEAFLALENM